MSGNTSMVHSAAAFGGGHRLVHYTLVFGSATHAVVPVID